MQAEIASRVNSNPKFHELVKRRNRFASLLSILMVIIYFTFILVLAFAKDLLGLPIGHSIITWGIPIGIGVIVSAFVLTGIYVHRANNEFDRLTREIVGDAT